MLEKITTFFLGRSEYALRLLPLAAGIAGTIAFAAVAREIASSGEAWLLAVLLLASSDKLIVQSNEVKHFTFDLAIAVALLWFVLRIAREARAARLGPLVARFGAVGALGLWLSFASLFSFAGTSLAIAAGRFRSWRGQERRSFLLANLAVGTSLLVLAAPIAAQRSDTVTGFWKNSFPDTASLGRFAYWIVRALVGFCNYFWQPFGVLFLALALVGVTAALRAGRRLDVSILWLPPAFAFVASFFELWPFGGNQHMVFAAPAVLLSVAEGLVVVRRELERRWQHAGSVFLLAVLLPGVGDAAYRTLSPRQRHEVRPVLEFVAANQRPEDQLLVFSAAEYEFYTGRKPEPIPRETDPLRRVWFIATRPGTKPPLAHDWLDRLAERRPKILEREEYGAAAYLFGPEEPEEEPRM